MAVAWRREIAWWDAGASCSRPSRVAALTMNIKLHLRVFELLTARLCHELSGPISAVSNGAELLAEGDPDLGGDALALVAASARRAANRLQFYRFAYGFAADGGGGPTPHELAAKFFEETQIICNYAESVRALPLDRQKLGCNLLLVGADALGRGGRLTLQATPAGLQLDAVGTLLSFTAEQAMALRLELAVGTLTTRTVNAYFAALLARAWGWRLAGTVAEPGRIRLSVAGTL
jgi:histidine phosphotransferase ChpT